LVDYSCVRKITMLGDISKSSAFRFENPQDALDLAYAVMEDSKRWLADNEIDFIKSYVGNEFQIVVPLRCTDDATDFDLVFEAIPTGVQVQPNDSANAFDIAQSEVGRDSEERVLVKVGYLVEGPEGVIPALVWLECPKTRVDFLREVFASPFYLVFEVEGTIGERKGHESGVCVAGGDGNIEASGIQRRTQIVNSIRGSINERIREAGLKPDLVNLALGTLRIILNNKSAWACRDKGNTLPVKLGHMLLCPRDLPA
jgi:hypothetical protein